jgi:hypothetical protein
MKVRVGQKIIMMARKEIPEATEIARLVGSGKV